MTRSFRTTLLLILLMASVSSPALARMVIGVTPAVMPGAADRATVAALEQELTARLGEPVQVRSFDSEAAQIDWLIRFRELDAALVSRGQMGALPAGTMITLADLPPAVAVTHPGMAAGQLDVLRRGFRSLAEDDRGRQLLKRLAGTAKVAVAAAAKPAPMATAAPAKPATIAPAVHPPIPPVVAPAPVTSRAAEPLPPPGSAPGRTGVVPAPPPPPAKAPAQPPVIQTPALKPQPSAPPATAAPQPAEPTSPKRTRLLLIAALVVLVGIGVKIMLLMRHWQQRRQAQDAPPQPPSAETFDYQGADAQPAPPVAALHHRRHLPPRLRRQNCRRKNLLRPSARPWQPKAAMTCCRRPTRRWWSNRGGLAEPRCPPCSNAAPTSRNRSSCACAPRGMKPACTLLPARSVTPIPATGGSQEKTGSGAGSAI